MIMEDMEINTSNVDEKIDSVVKPFSTLLWKSEEFEQAFGLQIKEWIADVDIGAEKAQAVADSIVRGMRSETLQETVDEIVYHYSK